MNRKAAATFIVLGLLIGVVGWHLLPTAPGRLDYAVEIVDPRPLAEATMPEGLRALHATRALAVSLPEGQAPRRLLLVSGIGKILSSGDTELGKLPGKEPNGTSSGPAQALAGANTGLGLGPATVGGVRLRVVAVLHHLGPVMDSSVVMSDAPGSLSALGPLAQKMSVRYLVLSQTPAARSRTLARLRAGPALVPPNAQVVSPAEPLPVPNSIRISLAVALVCVGVAVIAFQMRGVSRHEIAQRFARR